VSGAGRIDLLRGLELVVPVERSFDGVYGLEVVADEGPDGPLRARVRVRDELCRAGVLHGGVLCAVAESLASQGTLAAVAADGRVAMGLSNETSFLRPFTAGHVHAEARPVHRGRTTWVWTVDHRDDEGRLGAQSRVTVAVR
jgi:1,4-dihydroxy-2-naphthoyl-CoA hydrolase